MGAKQSGPAAANPPPANGRTRAYSGSDLPSSTSGTSSGNVGRTHPGGGGFSGGLRYHGASGASAGGAASTSQHLGARARSVGGSGSSGTRTQAGISIPNSGGAYSSQESGGSGSSPEEAAEREGQEGPAPRLMIGSLPAHLSPHLFAGKRADRRDGDGDGDERRVLTERWGQRVLLTRIVTHRSRVAHRDTGYAERTQRKPRRLGGGPEQESDQNTSGANR